jgi:hypothetical protein
MDTYSIYSGVDHLGTVGKVAPGLFGQEGRCWRMVYENAAGHESRNWSVRSGDSAPSERSAEPRRELGRCRTLALLPVK